MTTRRELANAIRALAMDAVAAGQLRSSGHADGHGGHRRGVVERVSAAQPGQPALVQPRPLRALQRARLDVAVRVAAPGRYALPMDELQRFRQLHSKTAGHPEYGHTPGVETTTGPLGQGLANAVGFALAEKLLARALQPPRASTIVDHHTYVLLGDGCLMEGISHEAASLAGTWRPGQAGRASTTTTAFRSTATSQGWFTDDTPARFEAYGWNVIRDVDGHDAGGGAARAIRSAHDANRQARR